MHLTDGEKFTSRDCAKFGAAANFTPSRTEGPSLSPLCGRMDGQLGSGSPERMFGKLPTVLGLCA